jgi:kanamycin kinase
MFPEPDLPVPATVRRLAGGASVEPVWINGDGGTTFRVNGLVPRFVKWQPHSTEEGVEREAGKLRWARQFTLVPEVLGQGHNESGAWLVLVGLPGESAVCPRWKADPETAVRVAGAALRRLHDALPVTACPFDWSVERRRRTVPSDTGDPRSTQSTPEIDRLVVCHGDACVPNTLIAADGTFAGHVDLADLGVADRWADLAVGSWSTEWNFGPGWEELYFQSYDIEPDRGRIRFYRELWAAQHPL